ncbi:MAG: valine--tRNA ligase [Myxococcota bacterium]
MRQKYWLLCAQALLFVQVMASTAAVAQSLVDNRSDGERPPLAPLPAKLPQQYDAARVQQYWQQRWQQANLFAVRAQDSLPAKKPPKQPYTALITPNVDGALHVGHALFVTLQDILVRTQRMRGKNALWLPGLDHAGIATHAVVERLLQRQEGKRRHHIGRAAFVDLLWQHKQRSGDRIIQQLQAMGASIDHSRLSFTMDPRYSQAVEHAFVKLWNRGLIYRSQDLVNWDISQQTTLSDEQLQRVRRKEPLISFAYRLVPLLVADAAAGQRRTAHSRPKQHNPTTIVVTTTRLETMLGDTAVAVHPADARYKQLVGRRVQHPFFADRTLPVIADAAVNPNVGSGAIGVAPAHGRVDFAIGRRHRLPIVQVLDRHGHMNAAAAQYQWLSQQQARQRIEQDLKILRLLRNKKIIEHDVLVSPYSHQPVELVISHQYFVRTAPLAQRAKQAVDRGDTQIIPASWKKSWDDNLNNMQDWHISRQLWWGHRVPVYHDLQALQQAIYKDAKARGGQTTPALAALLAGKAPRELLRIALDTLGDKQVRSFSVASTTNLAQQNPQRYVQEQEVLDTWFSSAIWPFAVLGWPKKTADFQAFYPNTIIETGPDVLFVAVARMMMLGIYLTKRAPFRHIYLHPMLHDVYGNKMSTSLGNTIDPFDVMQGSSLQQLQHNTKQLPILPSHRHSILQGIAKQFPEGIPAVGADGLRLDLALASGQKDGVQLSAPRLLQNQSLLLQLWSTTRFALSLKDLLAMPSKQAKQDRTRGIAAFKPAMSMCDRWILSRLNNTVQTVNQAIDTYRFDEAVLTLDRFIGSQLSDYMRCARTQLHGYQQAAKPSDSAVATAHVLHHVLEVTVRLLHPVCPFITEELWAHLQRISPNPSKHLFCSVADYPQADSELLRLCGSRPGKCLMGNGYLFAPKR